MDTAELLARLNEAQRTACIGSWSWDISNNTVWWSHELYRIFELTPQSFIPSVEANAQYVHPQDIAAYHEAVAKTLSTGEPLAEDLRIIAAGGQIKHCHSRGQIELDATGRPRRLFGTFQDITERRLIELALLDSEGRYRQIVEAAQEGIWQIDKDGKTVFVNARMAEILGYSREEMIGTSVLDFVDEKNRPKALSNIDRRRQGVAEQHDFVFRHKSGREVWTLVCTNPIQDASGAYAGALGMITDITERHRNEVALRASDARFRQLASSLPQLVWTCTADGSCDYLSSRWEEYTGKKASEQLGAAWLSQVHSEDRQRVVAEWQTAVSQHVEFRSEYRLKSKSGDYRWFDARAVPLFDEHGALIRWIGSNTDIEERRRAEESQLRTQKMEALGTLAGGIAHDFNNILMAIRGNAVMALGDLATDHPARIGVIEIEKASARAADLVRRILAFSRQEEPKREVLSLQPVIEEALKLLRSTLPAQIELRTDFAPDVACVHADATQVMRAVMNLATNAAHAIGSKRGIIELRLEPVDVPPAMATEVTALHTGPFVRISIRDNGCGIRADILDRIFDPFFTTKPVGEGTGLGLSVVHGIVKSHGGAVSVSSEPGQGTTFNLYFPVTHLARVSATQPPVVAAPIAGVRALYIDDDEALVHLTTRLLRRHGHVVTGYTDPLEALAAFKSRPDEFDVVITDLSMPKMTGFELATEIFATSPDKPLVLTSGNIRAEDQAAANKMGIRALVLKPDTVEELARAVDAVLAPATTRNN